MVAWPFRKLMCCLAPMAARADPESAARAPTSEKPVYVSVPVNIRSPLIDQMEDFTSSKAFHVSGRKASRRLA